MFNVCPACGAYAVEKAIDPAGPFAICPACGTAHRFVQLPLFVVTGASGAGKSAVALALPAALPECVSLEMDILWGTIPATAEDDYRSYDDAWLRLAKNIGQSGRPVVLLGSITPPRLAACSEGRYFSTIHILALVCDDVTLVARLQARPTWRASSTPAFLAAMRRFNQWFDDQAAQPDSPLTLLDTSTLTVAESVAQVAAWVRRRLSGPLLSTTH